MKSVYTSIQADDLPSLESIAQSGNPSSRRKAIVLLAIDKGSTPKEAAEESGLSLTNVYNVLKAYQANGLNSLIHNS